MCEGGLFFIIIIDVCDAAVKGTKIMNNSGKNIGKLITRFGGIGLALIHVQEMYVKQQQIIMTTTITTTT